MSAIIHIDGIDKTGKDTIRDKLIKKSKGDILVIVRSYLSQILYSRIYNRDIDESYFLNEMKNDISRGHRFYVLTANKEVIEKRFIKHDEKDILISEIEHHKQELIKLIEDLKINHNINEIKIIDTSYMSIKLTVDKILGEIYES